MKQLVEKIMPLIDKVKGKKPVVSIISIAAILLGYYAVSKGYISENLVDPDMIIKQVDKVFSNNQVDTIAKQIIVDTLNGK